MNKLLINTPEFFSKRFNIDVKVRHEVLSIDPEAKKIWVRDIKSSEKFEDHYDRLIITTGSLPIRIKMEGYEAEKVLYQQPQIYSHRHDKYMFLFSFFLTIYFLDKNLFIPSAAIFASAMAVTASRLRFTISPPAKTFGIDVWPFSSTFTFFF